MANLSSKIKEYAKVNGVANVDFTTDVMLQDDMVGGVSNPYIKEWNLDIAKPTDEQLATYETVANTTEANAQVIANRKALYGTPEEQIQNIMENGLQAEIDRVNQIKADNPKESE
jgi:hypothetical protein